MIRVIKPYIGGGFGNKQDVLYEPLNAYLCTLVGGRCVKMEISREETLACTRVRHAMNLHVKAAARKDGHPGGQKAYRLLQPGRIRQPRARHCSEHFK